MFYLERAYVLVQKFEVHISTLKNEEIVIKDVTLKKSIVINQTKEGKDLNPYWLHTCHFDSYQELMNTFETVDKSQWSRFKVEYKIASVSNSGAVSLVSSYPTFVKNREIIGYEIHAKNRSSLEPTIKDGLVSQVGPTKYYSKFIKTTNHLQEEDILIFINENLEMGLDSAYLEAVLLDTNTEFEQNWLN